MYTRRMRFAAMSNEQAAALFNDYLKDFNEYVNNLNDTVFNRLKSTFKSFKDINNSENEEKRKDNIKQFRQNVVELINGSGDFAGLSNMPELAGYGKFFEGLSKEYVNPGEKSTVGFGDESYGYNMPEEISAELSKNYDNYKYMFGKLKKNFETFIDAVVNEYGREVGKDWHKFSSGVIDLAIQFGNVMKQAIVEANNGQIVEYADSNFSPLMKIFTDIKYYASEMNKELEYDSKKPRVSIDFGKNKVTVDAAKSNLLKIMNDEFLPQMEESLEALGTARNIKEEPTEAPEEPAETPPPASPAS